MVDVHIARGITNRYNPEPDPKSWEAELMWAGPGDLHFK